MELSSECRLSRVGVEIRSFKIRKLKQTDQRGAEQCYASEKLQIAGSRKGVAERESVALISRQQPDTRGDVANKHTVRSGRMGTF